MDFGDILSQWDSIQKNHVPKNKVLKFAVKKQMLLQKKKKKPRVKVILTSRLWIRTARSA